jgi:SprT protein
MAKNREFRSMGGLDRQLQRRVIEETQARRRQAIEYFGREFPEIPVHFDLGGRAAGMYQVRAGERRIRYNPFIFNRYFEDNFAQTIPHEVAHYISDLLHGFRNIRPHGPEWRQVMVLFGAEPRATCNYDLQGLPVRRYRQYDYECGCRLHRLTTIRHNRVQGDGARYLCKQCGKVLVYSGAGSSHLG